MESIYSTTLPCSSTSQWSQVQKDIAANIFDFLDFKTRVRCQRVCKNWKDRSFAIIPSKQALFQKAWKEAVIDLRHCLTISDFFSDKKDYENGFLKLSLSSFEYKAHREIMLLNVHNISYENRDVYYLESFLMAAFFEDLETIKIILDRFSDIEKKKQAIFFAGFLVTMNANYKAEREKAEREISKEILEFLGKQGLFEYKYSVRYAQDLVYHYNLHDMICALNESNPLIEHIVAQMIRLNLLYQ